MDYPLARTDIPVIELTDQRFELSCRICARRKMFTYQQLIETARPHRNEYADELARRFRCAVGRYNHRACPVVIRATHAPYRTGY